MSTCSIDTYCNNQNDPSCSNVPQSVRDNYYKICQTRENWEKAGIAIGSLPMNILASIFTPEGLKIISIFKGLDLTGSVFYNAVARCIARGIGPEVMAAAENAVAEGGTSLVTNAILSTVIAEAVEEGSRAYYAFRALEMLTTGAEIFLWFLFLVQIIGGIIDQVDPLGINNELDAESLKRFSDSFNDMFMRSFLSNVSIGKDEFGRPIYYTQWPIEYYADDFINDSLQELDPDNYQKNYQMKLFTNTLEYWNNLHFNSNGDVIVYKNDNNLPSTDDFSIWARSLSIVFADQNTSVAKWLYNWLPLLILLLVLLVVLLIYIK